HLEFQDAEVLAVLAQGLHLQARDRIGNGHQPACALGAGGGHVVVGGGDVGAHPPRRAPGQAQALERLRRGDLVEDVAVDVDQRGTVVATGHFVHLPQLVVQGLAGHACLGGVWRWRATARRLEVHPAGLPLITQMDIFYPFHSNWECTWTGPIWPPSWRWPTMAASRPPPSTCT